MPSHPSIDAAQLTTPEAREAALDAIGVWFVDALVEAGGDRERAAEVIRHAISTFYDIRESAGQHRCEYAGHFFMVDAVGLDDSNRPIPWVELVARAPADHVKAYEALFDAIERDVK